MGLIRLILNPDQTEPLRGRGRAREATVHGPEHFAGPGFRRLPRPTSTSVPTIARTMLYRNPSASTSMVMKSLHAGACSGDRSRGALKGVSAPDPQFFGSKSSSPSPPAPLPKGDGRV